MLCKTKKKKKKKILIRAKHTISNFFYGVSNRLWFCFLQEFFCVCMHVCVCVYAREREGKREHMQLS